MKKVLQTFMNRRYIFAVLAMMCYGQLAMAQNPRYTIKGVITDARNKEPLPGAVVKLTGTTQGTSTDINGAYTLVLNVNEGTYPILISYTGYKPVTRTILLNQSSLTLNVELSEDALNLDEVVVTGTSVATSKKQLGNAISTVSAKELEGGAATSIDQALAGKVSGAQISQNSGNPAGGISVRLRGNSTISGSSDPLYIVDGVIVNNSSAELLDLGGYSQNRLVDINPADIDRIEIIKGAAGAAIYGSRASNGVVQIFTKKGKSGKPVVSFSTQFRTNSLRKKVETNEYPFRFANTTATDLTQIPVQRYDLQNEIFTTAYGTENNISVSGGSDKTQYYLSGGYLGNQGIIKNTDFKRATTRLRLDQRFNDVIKVSMGASYTFSGSNEIPNGGINSAYGAMTGFIFGNNFINPYPDPSSGVYPSLAPTGLRRTNPLEAVNRFDFSQQTSRFISDLQVNIEPLKNLSINYTLGFDNSTQMGSGYIPIGNTSPEHNAGFARKGDRINTLLNNDLNVAYRSKLGSWLESTTSAGATAQSERINSAIITGTQLSPVSQAASSGASIVTSDYKSTINILGFYIQQTFGIKNKLYLTGAVRNDVSSSFGEANRWQLYPKFSGAYILSEEEFWKNSSISSAIPSLKLRASYGQSGNLTAIGAYDRFSNYNSVSLAGLPGVSAPSQYGNPDIKPERQTEKEFGMDVSFLKNRLGLEVSYYDKAVQDLLLPVTLRPSSGYITQFQNIGNMVNKGFELMLKGVPVQTVNFKWNSTIIFSKNKNEVTDIPGGVVTFPGGFGQVAAVNGYPLGAFYATSFARTSSGELLLTPAGFPQRELTGRNTAGQPSGSVKTSVIGDPNPKWTGSFTNEFSIGKNLSLRMQWDASYGNDVFNFTRRVGDRDLYGGLKGYEAELRGEVPKGTSAVLFGIMENWIEDGSYLKFRELSASYDLRAKFLNNNPLRITVSGRNLMSIDKYKGWDPETNAAGQSTAVRGFDFVEVPIPRTIALGLNYTF
ncbi:TonB-linked outer membrane protein, SusC/RagA family [Daejeonella rubra]|uniref:TonB-linked outer membrane protein, SusC/RagA family n=1 Tax=Daejeonella rubra TaxID=990371 RepID=A0A1G9RS15_9SPHI|nr:SusC/RagA family TonB-linked outer membrane protein [Daejeonella rubra]SDM25954.1 TonB-linked outer membrane protein, SusC/RagA family [Daejeonella rubra]